MPRYAYAGTCTHAAQDAARDVFLQRQVGGAAGGDPVRVSSDAFRFFRMSHLQARPLPLCHAVRCLPVPFECVRCLGSARARALLLKHASEVHAKYTVIWMVPDKSFRA